MEAYFSTNGVNKERPMKNQFKNITLVIIIGLIATPPAHAIKSTTFIQDNAHFYQTPSFHGHHPNNAPAWTQVFEVSYAHGSARKGRDNHGNKTELLDTFGQSNLRELITRVSSIPQAVQNLYTPLQQADPTKQLGTVSFQGKLEVDDLQLRIRQHLAPNFFSELYIPLKNIRLTQQTLVDTSPDLTATNPTAQSAWNTLKTNLNTILNAYGLENFDRIFDNHLRLDDVSLYLGWQKAHKSPISFLPSMLLTMRAGLMLPLGSSTDRNHPFFFANGFNNHLAIPVHADLSFITKNCIKGGLHAGVTFFFDRFNEFRVKTSFFQSGMIRLEKSLEREKLGPLGFFGGYVMADQFLHGISCLAGYSFTAQEERRFYGHRSYDDATMKGWHTHAFHFLLEYDFKHFNLWKRRCWSPYLNVFFNYFADGRNTFATNMQGITTGTEINWKF